MWGSGVDTGKPLGIPLSTWVLAQHADLHCISFRYVVPQQAAVLWRFTRGLHVQYGRHAGANEYLG